MKTLKFQSAWKCSNACGQNRAYYSKVHPHILQHSLSANPKSNWLGCGKPYVKWVVSVVRGPSTTNTQESVVISRLAYIRICILKSHWRGPGKHVSFQEGGKCPGERIIMFVKAGLHHLKTWIRGEFVWPPPSYHRAIEDARGELLRTAESFEVAVPRAGPPTSLSLRGPPAENQDRTTGNNVPGFIYMVFYIYLALYAYFFYRQPL